MQFYIVFGIGLLRQFADERLTHVRFVISSSVTQQANLMSRVQTTTISTRRYAVENSNILSAIHIVGMTSTDYNFMWNMPMNLGV
jgi:hypothetical protein